MHARVQDAVQRKSPATLRQILKDIEKEKANAKLYADARKAARKAFTVYYEKAKAKLLSPAKGAKKGAFAVDPDLRKAFSTVLDELTESTDSYVYVAFTNRASLKPPKGTDKGASAKGQKKDTKTTDEKGSLTRKVYEPQIY